jgi:hypothetical protein
MVALKIGMKSSLAAPENTVFDYAADETPPTQNQVFLEARRSYDRNSRFFASLQNTDRLVWPLTGVAVVPILVVAMSSSLPAPSPRPDPLAIEREWKQSGELVRRCTPGSSRKGRKRSERRPFPPLLGISRERKPHHHLLLGADAHDLFELDVFGRTPDPDVHLVRFHFKSPFGGVPICQNARFQR